MQFKHPEILYALFLLLIPIIVHLFQLRRFQKQEFTNVAFLKEVVLQTRKSSQLKKWLILLTRMLLLACVILAFAQPFTSNNQTFNSEPETVIYLDNSFSMQAKGEQGELLKRAVQDLIDEVNPDEKISIVTNDAVFKNTTIKAIQNDLLQLEYSANQLPYDAALLKSNKLFTNTKNNTKNLIFISDFQQKKDAFTPIKDSIITLNLVNLTSVNKANIAIDSIYLVKTAVNTATLKVQLKNTGNPIDNVPVSLFDGDKLLAKTSVALDQTATAEFTLTEQYLPEGKIIIDDTSLQFDNDFYFNIDKASKINVLAINEVDDSFLQRLYGSDEFIYASTRLDQLNYSNIEKQNVIILNELQTIPNSLSNTLKTFTANGGYVVVIPSKEASIQTYNSFLLEYGMSLLNLNTTEKHVTNINYSHPVYANVFDKQVSNFQYPKVAGYFPLAAKISSAPLKFEDGKGFLYENKQLFLFTAPLNKDNSNFINSPLIVPTFYNMARQSLKTPDLYYTIGRDNTFDVTATMKQDAILSLKNEAFSMIPQQQYFNNKVTITTNETPDMAGVYSVINDQKSLKNVSYNFDRDESLMTYQDIASINGATVSSSVADILKILKSNSKVNELWKWFIIFALAFLIIEMLILKYFK